MHMEKNLKSKVMPLVLAVVVIVLDQITKMLVVNYIQPYTIGAQFFGDFIRLIHVYNTGVAFSVGAGWPDLARRILFSIIPVLVLVLVMVVYFRNNDFTKLQRWAISGIVGGGFGNIIDRIFRSNGVIDFIDVKWFGIEKSPIGLFRMTRWPTFNVADSAVVVCGILLLISFAITISKESKSKKADKEAKGEK